MQWAETAADIDTISSAYDSPVSLPDRVKIWLTLVHTFFPKTTSGTEHDCECTVFSVRRWVADFKLRI